MKLFKAIFKSGVFLLLGLAFFALVAWEWSVGIAAGSYGGASFKEMPGLAWFIVIIQLAMGAMAWMSALACLRGTPEADGRSNDEGDAAGPPIGWFDAVHALVAGGLACTVVAVGAWAAWDMAAMVLRLFRESQDDLFARILTASFLAGSVGVFIYLFCFLIGQPLFAYWMPRVRAALAYFRARA